MGRSSGHLISGPDGWGDSQFEDGEGVGEGEVGVGELEVFEAGEDLAEMGAWGEAAGDEAVAVEQGSGPEVGVGPAGLLSEPVGGGGAGAMGGEVEGEEIGEEGVAEEAFLLGEGEGGVGEERGLVLEEEEGVAAFGGGKTEAIKNVLRGGDVLEEGGPGEGEAGRGREAGEGGAGGGFGDEGGPEAG